MDVYICVTYQSAILITGVILILCPLRILINCLPLDLCYIQSNGDITSLRERVLVTPRPRPFRPSPYPQPRNQCRELVIDHVTKTWK